VAGAPHRFRDRVPQDRLVVDDQNLAQAGS
jgi:hypothetical protein